MATLKVIFKLKEPKSKEPTLINMFFNYGYYETDQNGKKKYIPLKYSTGEKINPKFWNDNPVYRVKETKKFPEFPEFNEALENLESGVKTVYRRLINDKYEVTPEILRKELNIYLEKTKRSPKTNLFSFIEKFIEEVGTARKPNTIKKYKTTQKHLIDYSETKKKKVDFDNIDLDFYYSFRDYLIKDLLFTENTAGKYISTLKAFLNEATERGINKKFDYKSKRFITPHEEVDKIYLNEKELKIIYELDLSDNSKLERVRDLFILECYLGLRFSDIEHLRPENLQTNPKGSFLKIKTIKTGEMVVIPLHWIAKSIFDKYQNNLPRIISNQKTNKYLKDIGELAKLNDMVEVVKTKGGRRISQTKPKYKLLTTHVARRSFATNLYLAGIPTISIMKITGHRTERSFLKYIKISQEENAQKLLEHPYFQSNSNLKVI